MNTSILYQYTITSVVALRNALPEIHAKYTIGNFNLSAGVYDWVARYTTFSNKTNPAEVTEANGALIMLMEEFKQGNFSTIGAKYINRMWTLRVPENIRIPKLENQI